MKVRINPFPSTAALVTFSRIDRHIVSNKKQEFKNGIILHLFGLCIFNASILIVALAFIVAVVDKTVCRVTCCKVKSDLFY